MKEATDVRSKSKKVQKTLERTPVPENTVVAEIGGKLLLLVRGNVWSHFSGGELSAGGGESITKGIERQTKKS